MADTSTRPGTAPEPTYWDALGTELGRMCSAVADLDAGGQAMVLGLFGALREWAENGAGR
jgi:hypothetical protein